MDNQFKIKIFLIYNNYWILIILYVTLINLCSLPFLAGFYSKDFFLLYFLSYNNFNRIYIIRIFFLIFFTIIYSFNIVNLIVIQKHSILFIKNKKRYVYSSSLINIFFYSLFIGFFISWNFFYFEEFCYLTPNWSIIIFTINASLVYFLINKKQNSFLKKKNYYQLFSKIWLLKECHIIFLIILKNFSFYYQIGDKTYLYTLEYNFIWKTKNFINFFLNNNQHFININNSFKIIKIITLIILFLYYLSFYITI